MMHVWMKITVFFAAVISKAMASSNTGNDNSNSTRDWSISNEANTDYHNIIGFLSPENCRLRSKKYISNGLCTSPKPISEVVCAETCTMPAGVRTPYTFHLSSLRRRRSSNRRVRSQKLIKWRCTEASVRKKRVKLLCHDGTIRGYGLRIVTSCQCLPVTGKAQTKKHTDNKISSSTN